MSDKSPGQAAYEAQPDADKKIPWKYLLPKKRGEWDVIALAAIKANNGDGKVPSQLA